MYKKKLAGLIADSDLNKDQKELWQLFLLAASPEEDEAVYEAISEDKEGLQLLTKHLRDKIIDMKDTHKKAWHRLTDEAKNFCQGLA